MSGSLLLADCILAVKDKYRWLWTSPKFSVPLYGLTSVCDQKSTELGLRVATTREGQVVAQFKNEVQAHRWVAFMQGARMGK